MNVIVNPWVLAAAIVTGVLCGLWVAARLQRRTLLVERHRCQHILSRSLVAIDLAALSKKHRDLLITTVGSISAGVPIDVHWSLISADPPAARGQGR